MTDDFQVTGQNAAALFTLKIHRGDGMALIAMNWRGTPPRNFVGFAIEYEEPGGSTFFSLKNRIAFPEAGASVNPNRLSTRLSPIQKFRWVHFPRNAELAGDFTYMVTPVFMNQLGELSYGESQQAALELRRETYAGRLNVAYTRGFVSSQAFVERYVTATDGIATLLPKKAADGLDFVPTHPKAAEALQWMGFEARSAILDVLDRAIADPAAQVRVVAFDLSEGVIVSRLQALGPRLKIIVDDSADHSGGAAEDEAATRLRASAGAANVKRQHMSALQHNKTIVVDSPAMKTVVCGSTNFSWRGSFVQNNNAIVLQGPTPVQIFSAAFDRYWAHGTASPFQNTASATWADLALAGIDAKVSFSPHSPQNALLQAIGDDIRTTESCLFYSLAFLAITDGAVRDAITSVTGDADIFVYGIADKEVGGFDLLMPDGNVAPVFPVTLQENVPEPFKSEPAGGGGTRLHHKFVVIDFDKPTARVYCGSYNVSGSADTSNGENLLLIRDRRIAVSYTVEALRIFDHYHFRVLQQNAATAMTKIQLRKAPLTASEEPWWDKDYRDPRRIRDRELFA